LGHPIVFTGYRSRPLIEYTGRGQHWGGVLQTSNCRPWCASHDIVIEHLRIYGRDLMESGVFEGLGAYGVAVVDCVISHTGSSGIALNAIDYAYVAHNRIYHAGYGRGWSSGISLWYGGGSSAVYGGAAAAINGQPGFHNFIIGNVISGSYDNSYHHTDGNGIIVDGTGSIPPVLIANNLVYENGGSGVAVGRTSGPVWVVNNTGYANGLDRRVSGGYAADFLAADASSVHFVNNVAYGRRHGVSYTYNNTHSSISWSHNLGYDGITSGVPRSITSNRRYYRYANPRFVSVPAVPSGPSPWARATPPWRLGRAFHLRRRSAARGSGIVPSRAPGITAQLAFGLRLAGFP
jgi:hypothetical protein